MLLLFLDALAANCTLPYLMRRIFMISSMLFDIKALNCVIIVHILALIGRGIVGLLMRKRYLNNEEKLS